MIPQLPAFTVAEQNGKFAARCIISFADGCPDAVAQERSSHGSSLQIVRCSFLHWNVRGARLAHETRRGRIFGTPCCSGRGRTAGQKRDARYRGDQANGCLCVSRLHKRRARQTVGDDSNELFCAQQVFL